MSEASVGTCIDELPTLAVFVAEVCFERLVVNLEQHVL
jgi:hypothetical protein